MGLNTIHDSSKDFLKCKNLRTNETFKCSINNNIDYEGNETISGISITKIKIVLRVNGYCNVKEDDRIMTPLYDYPLRIVGINEIKTNQLQFKKRANIGMFVSMCDIYLE